MVNHQQQWSSGQNGSGKKMQRLSLVLAVVTIHMQGLAFLRISTKGERPCSLLLAFIISDFFLAFLATPEHATY